MSKYHSVNCRQQYRDCPHGHASLREHRRWQELDLMQRAGEIRNLRQQVPFELVPPVTLNGRKKPAIRYLADFAYEEPTDIPNCKAMQHVVWREVVEDAKGVVTHEFRIKAHLMKAVYGIDVVLS